MLYFQDEAVELNISDVSAGVSIYKLPKTLFFRMKLRPRFIEDWDPKKTCRQFFYIFKDKKAQSL